MYYLQTTKDRKVWEDVDKYCYQNRAKAVLADGTRRYTGNAVSLNEDGTYSLSLTDATKQELSIIMRFLSVSPESGAIPGGFVRTPEYVKFLFPQGAERLHEVGGSTFRKAA